MTSNAYRWRDWQDALNFRKVRRIGEYRILQITYYYFIQVLSLVTGVYFDFFVAPFLVVFSCRFAFTVFSTPPTKPDLHVTDQFTFRRFSRLRIHLSRILRNILIFFILQALVLLFLHSKNLRIAFVLFGCSPCLYRIKCRSPLLAFFVVSLLRLSIYNCHLLFEFT